MHRPSPDFPQHLEALYRRFPFERSLAQDPLSGVRPLAQDRAHAEVAAIVAATLAVGNTTAIRSAFAEVLRRVDGDLRGAVERMARPDAPNGLRGFRHRWIRGEHIAHLLYRLHRVDEEEGSLEAVFRSGLVGSEGFAGGLDALAGALRGPPGRPRDGPKAPPGYTRLFPTPLGPTRSAAKRPTLFVRWMTRTSYPDLGLWSSVSPSVLRIPLDQHVHWIAYHLGLTERKTRNWSAVEEITGALRAIDPVDPIKYDFVLCHTGVSGDCPKRADIAVCGPCAVRPDCRLWRRRRVAA
jgi:uncharacterized protein (TIGR02757 family)